jgi:homoaconitase/3-isopropylmalate dehydratase large subunit
MKIPRKKELLELQKKYQTDKKIGEVYGVPGRLVTYWRSKKNIGPYNKPKYSREKIMDIWERYGDDRLAGAELGISGPGFHQWRIKYAIKNKPTQLRMEQLELDFADFPSKTKSLRQETFARKLLARKAGLKTVEEGEVVTVEPDLMVAVDNVGLAIDQFYNSGNTKVFDQSKVAIILDYLLTSEPFNTANEHKKIREFAKKQGIMMFYDIGWGISQQVVIEEGLILPGQLAVGTNRHAAAYGCIGTYSTCVEPQTMANIWATGKIQLKVPPTTKIVINGHLHRGVTTSDIILKLSRDINKLAAGNRAVEFYGRTVSEMNVSRRITLTNFAIDAGAASAVVPFDDIIQKYLKKITKAKYKPVKADIDAGYENEIEFDVSYLTPLIGYDNNFKNIKPVEELAGKRIDHVVLGGCTNGRLEDLEIAALILRGRRIHRNTRMFIVPSSRKTCLEAIDKGYIRTFIESGCLVFNPSHHSCLNANHGMLAEGERALTTTCRNALTDDKDSNSPEIYVASPATAAATALAGRITDPRKYLH